MQDIERGPVSKLERIMSASKRLLLQKRNLYTLFFLWLFFCAILYGFPETVYRWIVGVNTTAVVQVLKEQLPVVEAVPIPIPLPTDSLKRLEYVRKHANMYDGMLSTPYEFVARLRNDVDLAQISVDMDVVIEHFDYYCLSAVHIGYPKHIMKIGGTLYVNSQIIGNDSPTIEADEESAFYPDVHVIKTRYGRVEVEYFDNSGYQQTVFLEGFNSICAQHLLDTMNGLKFKVADEL